MQPLPPLQVSAHSLSGSVRTGMAPQVPLVPPFFAALHAWHWPLQTLLQQKLSTQLVLAHSAPTVQAVPLANGAAHAPPAAQVSAPEHSLSGSVPAVTLPQVPFVPPVFAAEHAWQVPPHAVLQQTPSAQKPDAHSPAAAHAPPSGLAHVLLPLQMSAPAHSLSGSWPETIGPQVPFVP